MSSDFLYRPRGAHYKVLLFRDDPKRSMSLLNEYYEIYCLISIIKYVKLENNGMDCVQHTWRKTCYEKLHNEFVEGRSKMEQSEEKGSELHTYEGASSLRSSKYCGYCTEKHKNGGQNRYLTLGCLKVFSSSFICFTRTERRTPDGTL